MVLTSLFNSHLFKIHANPRLILTTVHFVVYFQLAVLSGRKKKLMLDVKTESQHYTIWFYILQCDYL